MWAVKRVSLCSFCVIVGNLIESDDDELRGRTKLQLAAESSGTYVNEVDGHIIGKLSSSVGNVGAHNDASQSDYADYDYAGTVEQLTEDSEARLESQELAMEHQTKESEARRQDEQGKGFDSANESFSSFWSVSDCASLGTCYNVQASLGVGSWSKALTATFNGGTCSKLQGTGANCDNGQCKCPKTKDKIAYHCRTTSNNYAAMMETCATIWNPGMSNWLGAENCDRSITGYLYRPCYKALAKKSARERETWVNKQAINWVRKCHDDVKCAMYYRYEQEDFVCCRKNWKCMVGCDEYYKSKTRDGNNNLYCDWKYDKQPSNAGCK